MAEVWEVSLAEYRWVLRILGLKRVANGLRRCRKHRMRERRKALVADFLDHVAWSERRLAAQQEA